MDNNRLQHRVEQLTGMSPDELGEELETMASMAHTFAREFAASSEYKTANLANIVTDLALVVRMFAALLIEPDSLDKLSNHPS